MKYIFVGLLVSVGLLAGTLARGDVNTDVEEAISSKVQDASRWDEVLSSEDSSEVEFRQFFVGFTPSVSIGINSVLDFKVAPQITLVWEKTELDQ